MMNSRTFQRKVFKNRNSTYLTFEYIHEGLTLKLFENWHTHINFQIDPPDVEEL